MVKIGAELPKLSPNKIGYPFFWTTLYTCTCVHYTYTRMTNTKSKCFKQPVTQSCYSHQSFKLQILAFHNFNNNNNTNKRLLEDNGNTIFE